jgi:hypothetical protein
MGPRVGPALVAAGPTDPGADVVPRRGGWETLTSSAMAPSSSALL